MKLLDALAWLGQTTRCTLADWGYGARLLSRLLRSGETVGVEGARPLRLRVGNAAGTEARWLGRVVPLEDVQRNNVADVELP